MECIYTILGGDFNVEQNVAMDRNSNMTSHKKCQEYLTKLIEEEEMVDIWHVQNPNKKYYTYMHAGQRLNWLRIDYFLISQSLQMQCVDSNIIAAGNTDHSAIEITISTSETKRGPGIWHFNNGLLQDSVFIEQLKLHVNDIKRKFSHLNAMELWELLKFEIAQFCREISEDKARKLKEDRFNLYVKLSDMQEELLKDSEIDRALLHNISLLKKDIDCYETVDAKRSAFRCQREWISKGERMSKYYFNLEKRNYMSKTMYIVKKSDGSLTKDYREILNLQFKFYDNLYTSNPRVKFDLLPDADAPHLPQETRDKLEKTISMDKVFDALMTLWAGKVSGGDGLSLELYRELWTELKLPLYQNYMLALSTGYLNPSAKRSIINLIPKKCKDDLLIKNWRPITLLNVDYKIWAKAIANRLEETTDYGLNNKTVDFEKCFDRVEYASIAGALEFFGFGPFFVQMIFLLFNKLQLCTTTNGYVSKFMSKTRGCNQGCPASPLVFNYCGETMSYLIHKNVKIKGLNIRDVRQLLSQFVDDTAVFLSFDQLELDAFTETMSHIEAQMGLKISYDKTTIYHVGSLFNTNAQLYMQHNYQWSNDPIELLGTYIPCDGTLHSEQNY